MNKSILYNALTISLTITLVYGYMYSTMKEDFGFTEDTLDPYYFALTTMSTVGYGDFTPKTRRAKLLAMTQFVLIMSEIIKVISN